MSTFMSPPMPFSSFHSTNTPPSLYTQNNLNGNNNIGDSMRSNNIHDKSNLSVNTMMDTGNTNNITGSTVPNNNNISATTPQFTSMASPLDSFMEWRTMEECRSLASPSQYFRPPLPVSSLSAPLYDESIATPFPSFSPALSSTHSLTQSGNALPPAISLSSSSSSALSAASTSTSNATPNTTTASTPNIHINTNAPPSTQSSFGIAPSPVLSWSLPSPSFTSFPFFSPSPKVRQSPRLMHKPPEFSGLLLSPLARKRRASAAFLSSPNWNLRANSPPWDTHLPYSNIPLLAPESMGAEDELSSVGSSVLSPMGVSSSVNTSPSSVRTSPMLSMRNLSPRYLSSQSPYYLPSRRLSTALLSHDSSSLENGNPSTAVKKETQPIPSYTNLPTLETLRNISNNQSLNLPSAAEASSSSLVSSPASTAADSNEKLNLPASSSVNPSKEIKRATGVSCHQCKTRRSSADLYKCCKQHPKKGRRKRKKERFCRKKYCERCLFKFYGETMPPPQLVNNSASSANGAVSGTSTSADGSNNPLTQAVTANGGFNWVCPSCRGLCTCAACKRNTRKTERERERERERADRERKSKSSSRMNKRYEPYPPLQATPANTVVSTVPAAPTVPFVSSKK